MKKLMLVLLLTIAYAFAPTQAQTTIEPLGFTEDSISINTNIKLHDAVSFNNLVFTFKKVIIDSRCPKGVKCVRAGEAKILISIFEDGVFLKNKEVVIDGEGYIFKTNMLFKLKGYDIYVSALHPYPKVNEKILNESYNADFFVMRNYRQ